MALQQRIYRITDKIFKTERGVYITDRGFFVPSSTTKVPQPPDSDICEVEIIELEEFDGEDMPLFNRYDKSFNNFSFTSSDKGSEPTDSGPVPNHLATGTPDPVTTSKTKLGHSGVLQGSVASPCTGDSTPSLECSSTTTPSIDVMSSNNVSCSTCTVERAPKSSNTLAMSSTGAACRASANLRERNSYSINATAMPANSPMQGSTRYNTRTRQQTMTKPDRCQESLTGVKPDSCQESLTGVKPDRCQESLTGVKPGTCQEPLTGVKPDRCQESLTGVKPDTCPESLTGVKPDSCQESLTGVKRLKDQTKSLHTTTSTTTNITTHKQCKSCQKRFASTPGLDLHFFRQHPEEEAGHILLMGLPKLPGKVMANSFICQQCHEVVNGRMQLKRHITSHVVNRGKQSKDVANVVKKRHRQRCRVDRLTYTG